MYNNVVSMTEAPLQDFPKLPSFIISQEFLVFKDRFDNLMKQHGFDIELGWNYRTESFVFNKNRVIIIGAQNVPVKVQKSIRKIDCDISKLSDEAITELVISSQTTFL